VAVALLGLAKARTDGGSARPFFRPLDGGAATGWALAISRFFQPLPATGSSSAGPAKIGGTLRAPVYARASFPAHPRRV